MRATTRVRPSLTIAACGSLQAAPDPPLGTAASMRRFLEESGARPVLRAFVEARLIAVFQACGRRQRLLWAEQEAAALYAINVKVHWKTQVRHAPSAG